MNKEPLQKLVRGTYGRKIAYVEVEEVTESNVLSIVAKAISVLSWNKPVIKYLWDYKKGDQPVLYRTKTVRDDILNTVVENHAWEIVRFKNAQTYGEPVQLISLSNDEKVNNAVDKLNDFFRSAGKELKDINSGEWTSAVGTGFKAMQKKDGDIPFRLVTPTPMNTVIAYSKFTEEPLLSVQEMKDADGNLWYLCFSDTHEYHVQNSQLLMLGVGEDGTGYYSKLHAYGQIPIIEYPNNQDRISDIELVISMLDAINEMQSNRQDAIAQFVQSWIKFVNCEVDEESFLNMKMMGALVVKSNNAENKADVDVMSQELNQTEAQVAKDDLWENILAIEGIPGREAKSGGGDTQGAVSLRNGWDVSKQAAHIKDAYIKTGDKKLALLVANRLRIAKGINLGLSIMDFDVQISHSPLDNLMTKTEALKMLLEAGIHPLIALKTSGLWADAEKTFLMSKPYLDALYETIDDKEAQEQKAQELMNK